MNNHQQTKEKDHDLIPFKSKIFLDYIGILAFILPLILVLGAKCECEGLLHSLSAYYHTSMDGVFVGVLCVIAALMFAYKGYKNEGFIGIYTDNILGNIGALGLLGVAFVPTNVCSDLACVEPYNVGWSNTVHYISAAVVFSVLAILCLFRFTKTDEISEHKIYKGCGWTIVVSMVIMLLYSYVLKDRFEILEDIPVVLIGEWISLWAFALAWWTKGEGLTQQSN